MTKDVAGPRRRGGGGQPGPGLGTFLGHRPNPVRGNHSPRFPSIGARRQDGRGRRIDQETNGRRPGGSFRHAALNSGFAVLFTKNFVAVFLINLCVMTAYYLLFVICSPFALERFNASPSTAGLVAGLILIGCLGGRFVTGRIIGTAGFKKVLFTGLVVYIASLALYLVTHNLFFFMVVRFCSGIGIGCIGTVTGTLVAHIVPPQQHGAGINYFSLSTILALALGPFLGIFLMQFLPFEMLFLLCIGLGVVSFAFALILSYPPLESDPAGHEQPSGFRMSDYIAHEAVPLSWVVLFVSVGYGNVQAFLSFYARELELVESASFFFLAYSATALCLRPFAGKLFDRRGANVIMYPSIAVAACGLLLLSHASSSVVLLLVGALLGAGIGNFQTTAQASSIKLVPRRRFAQATSTYFIFLDFGIGIGPYALGFLVPSVGYRGLYFAAAVLTALCVPLYYLAHGRRRIRP